MDMEIYFPGNKRVYANYGGFTIETDQPARAAATTRRRRRSICFSPPSAPAPASMPSTSCSSAASTLRAPSSPCAPTLTRLLGLIDKITLELKMPAGFPDKYRDAVVNAMNLCAVKKHLAQPPSFEITTVAG